uniref:AlNc14C60G4440 protein n=1 Tax=Albugo laibachii Nc14 TaxID=890382 RepID=F0WCR0_9STRA|nr:AlNc14C60G4440 [Albugo laibachii Nc14]|eukprot:CCA18981.1 AlNc14C60G4440 [Albugo laibachii Nc14]
MLQTVFNDEELKLLTLDLPSSHRAFIVTARIKVMMFTFGASFTYHLLSQDFFGMATCVEVAECLTLLITKECGTEFAFEGITALVSETLDNIALFSLTNDSSGCDAVFKSCMHVLCTLYQVNTEDSSNLGVIQATASGPITAALRKVLEATIVLEWAWKPTKNSVSIRGDVGTTVHRDLYKFFRLLLQQSHTRVLLAQIMIPREDKNTSLQLEHGLLRMYVVWLDCTCTASYDLRPILVHFSKFCLRIATDTQKSATSRLLARHCYSAAIMNSENSKYLILNKKPIQVSHFPLYVVAPFSSEELQVFTIRLRRVDEEVNGIYQYTFTAESMNHCDLSSIEAIEVLEKKNIRFKGSIVHRGVETLNAEKRGTRSSSATPKKTSPTDKVIELLIQDQESYKSSELTDAIESSRAMMYSRSNGSQEGVDIGKDGADTNISPLKPNMSTEQRKKKENCCLQ